MTFQEATKTFEFDESLLAGHLGLRFPIHKQIVGTSVTADADGNKAFTAGYWATDAGRLYPADKATIAGTAVTVQNAQLFAVGEVISTLYPTDRAVFAGNWAAGDSVSITLDGSTKSLLLSAATDAATAATELATLINADAFFSKKVAAVADGVDLFLYSVDGAPYAYAMTETTAGTGTITGDAVALAIQTIGTITAIDTATNVITLGANAWVDVIGVPVGVAGLKVDGILLTGIDLNRESSQVGLCVSASLVGARLPYWDAYLANQFPEIKII